MAIGIVNVSSRGQIVIPEAIRKKLNIKEGTKLIAIGKDKKLILQKEEDVMGKIYSEEKDEKGWLALAEESLKEIWDNKEDEKIWSKYLND